MTTAIEFSHISKYFRMEREKPRAFQDLFISLAQRRKNRKAKEFWALKDVTFNVQRGETVGLIGSNGSGKSTSLKLVSRIISPTAGSITINGHVTALLELGSGFHPDLSGRDNIFLNGTIMGLSRNEVERKVDAIIDFAELQDFIDVPIKNYSSGMYARLGFAVAVHLDPEILLIDEVLSVGDQGFQQKCAERMIGLRRKGITIFLVSHDLDTVSRLCSRAIWLDHGEVRMDGPASDITEAYYKFVLEQSTKENRIESWSENRLGSGEAHITRIEFLGEEMHQRRVFLTNEPLIVRLYYKAEERVEHPAVGLVFHHAATLTHLSGPNNTQFDYHIPYLLGEGYVDYRIERLPFLPGDYLVSTAIYDWDETHCFDAWYQCGRFTVVPGGTKERYGLLALGGSWSHSDNIPRSTGVISELELNGAGKFG